MSAPIVVNISGGIASWACARVLVDAGERPTLLFADTNMEDEDLYRFLGDASENLGIPITRIADGRNPWEVFRDTGYIGNTRVDPCSKTLKRQLLDKWHRANASGRIAIGLTIGEESRAARVAIHLPLAVFPLINAKIDKEACFAMAERAGLRLPRLYDMGFEHNNCGGFCIKAGHGQFRRLLETMPERFAYHEQQEAALRARLGDVSILRDRRGGITRPLPLAEFRRRVQADECEDAVGGQGCSCMEDFK